MADVSVANLTRRFGPTVAFDGISFDVRAGEFLTLLGPSGCGKSTTLAALAGLDRPDAGRITIGGHTMFDAATGVFVDAQHRSLGLMFQSYALWPHMTVFKNIDFALELRSIRGKHARARVDEVLAMVDMEAYADRYPGELSGGQQQRVALARTLAYRPRILLLDEPLSNLDAKLRERARIWLGDLQRRTGVTTVYVTHDQGEALSLSDRIVVMNGGKIAQIGSPKEVYDQPSTAFVADFVGASNLLRATLTRDTAGGSTVVLDGAADAPLACAFAALADGPVTVSVRPENLRFASDRQPNAVPYRLLSTSFLGARTLFIVEVGGQVLRVETQEAAAPEAGYLVVPEHTLRAFQH